MISWFETKFQHSHSKFAILQISLKYGHLYYMLVKSKKYQFNTAESLTMQIFFFFSQIVSIQDRIDHSDTLK